MSSPRRSTESSAESDLATHPASTETAVHQSAEGEIQSGQRFAFGKNWASFLKTLDDSRISIAVDSLKGLLQSDTLKEKRFLDAGSGSGLFSLAARKLGARVVSFDFDDDSVACTSELKRMYETEPSAWSISQGSVLDADFLAALGQFDVVYSWGVLHHTGQMWKGIELLQRRVHPHGLLVLAIYNDQGLRSKLWRRVKEVYCSGSTGRFVVKSIFYPWFTVRTILVSLIRRDNEFRSYRRKRGMSITHDWDDWLGGLPFEVARFEDTVARVEAAGFRMVNSKRTRRLGCHEFVFEKLASPL